MEPQKLYKFTRIPSLADALTKRSQNIIAERQEKRREFFWGSKIDREESPPVDFKKISRAEMLRKWKAEKMKKLEEEKKKQKPIFKVGIVHRKVTGSPVIAQPKDYLKKTFIAQKTYQRPGKKEPEVEGSGVLTRAKAKNLGVKPKVEDTKPVTKSQNNKFCKYEAGKKKPIDSHVFRVPEAVSKLSCKGLTYPYSPKILKRIKKSLNPQEKKGTEKAAQIKQQPKVEISKLQDCLKDNKKEGMAEKKVVLQPKQVSPARKNGNEEDGYTPIVYSPFVTVRSGKKSKRGSKKILSIDVEEQIHKEEREFKCRIFSFRKYIEDERRRLLELCEKWSHIYREFQEIPLDVEGDIDAVVGKTKLLTSDKFMQFKGLIEKCENGDPFVKVDDLQGFQDWVSIEVEKIDGEFHKLEKRKCNDWKLDTAPVNVNKAQKVKVAKNRPKKPVGSSNIRSHILAARKLLKEGNADAEKSPQLISFEVAKAGTPQRKESLLKDVLNSETSRKNKSADENSSANTKKRSSGLEIMVATQKNKFPTPVKLQKSPLLKDFEIIVGKEETPSRSILKKTPKTAKSSKGHVTFQRDHEKSRENSIAGRRGLSERYFQPLTDEESSPMRTILGDLGNLASSGMKTRSKSRQVSYNSFS